MATVKKKGRGNPKGPPKRGRRGHSSIDEQKGFADWLDAQLLAEPRPTYAEIGDSLRSSGFYASRSALARYGLAFETRKREMRLLLEKARVLAAEDPETILVLEKATSNLIETKIFDFLLGRTDAGLDEKDLGVIFAHARLQSSSASRERAAVVASGKFRSAMRALQRSLEEKLRNKPELALQVVALIEKAYTEVANR
jgi:Arc/MetJ-type ribon-helix-helix transcriptional regulator